MSERIKHITISLSDASVGVEIEASDCCMVKIKIDQISPETFYVPGNDLIKLIMISLNQSVDVKSKIKGVSDADLIRFRDQLLSDRKLSATDAT